MSNYDAFCKIQTAHPVCTAVTIEDMTDMGDIEPEGLGHANAAAAPYFGRIVDAVEYNVSCGQCHCGY